MLGLGGLGNIGNLMKQIPEMKKKFEKVNGNTLRSFLKGHFLRVYFLCEKLVKVARELTTASFSCTSLGLRVSGCIRNPYYTFLSHKNRLATEHFR